MGLSDARHYMMNWFNRENKLQQSKVCSHSSKQSLSTLCRHLFPISNHITLLRPIFLLQRPLSNSLHPLLVLKQSQIQRKSLPHPRRPLCMIPGTERRVSFASSGVFKEFIAILRSIETLLLLRQASRLPKTEINEIFDNLPLGFVMLACL